MTPIDILITNRNSREAIQLCVESVRFHTTPGTYQIIVYDDCSDNDIDLPYLRQAQAKGWLRLIEGRERALHGGGINLLLNEVCQADYAVLLDCDIEIRRDGWLDSLMLLVRGNDRAIGAVNCLHHQIRGTGHWIAPFCEFWFGLLNMKAYRDGMMVDWRPVIVTDPAEIARLAPELANEAHEPVEQYIFDVGCKLYHKVLTDNPKHYYFISPLPEEIKQSFRHYRQVSHLIGAQTGGLKRHVDGQFDAIRASLNAIRGARGEE